jgi:hypothetical protein
MSEIKFFGNAKGKTVDHSVIGKRANLWLKLCSKGAVKEGVVILGRNQILEANKLSFSFPINIQESKEEQADIVGFTTISDYSQLKAVVEKHDENTTFILSIPPLNQQIYSGLYTKVNGVVFYNNSEDRPTISILSENFIFGYELAEKIDYINFEEANDAVFQLSDLKSNEVVNFFFYNNNNNPLDKFKLDKDAIFGSRLSVTNPFYKYFKSGYQSGITAFSHTDLSEMKIKNAGFTLPRIYGAKDSAFFLGVYYGALFSHARFKILSCPEDAVEEYCSNAGIIALNNAIATDNDDDITSVYNDYSSYNFGAADMMAFLSSLSSSNKASSLPSEDHINAMSFDKISVFENMFKDVKIEYDVKAEFIQFRRLSNGVRIQFKELEIKKFVKNPEGKDIFEPISLYNALTNERDVGNACYDVSSINQNDATYASTAGTKMKYFRLFIKDNDLVMENGTKVLTLNKFLNVISDGGIK